MSLSLLLLDLPLVLLSTETPIVRNLTLGISRTIRADVLVNLDLINVSFRTTKWGLTDSPIPGSHGSSTSFAIWGSLSVHARERTCLASRDTRSTLLPIGLTCSRPLRSQRCTEMYDVSFFLRVRRDVLRERRETRATYVTQSESRHLTTPTRSIADPFSFCLSW